MLAELDEENHSPMQATAQLVASWELTITETLLHHEDRTTSLAPKIGSDSFLLFSPQDAVLHPYQCRLVERVRVVLLQLLEEKVLLLLSFLLVLQNGHLHPLLDTVLPPGHDANHPFVVGHRR